ncbi:MAG: type II CRISPR RNA-guided endonuclease Cas9 [Bacteroidales bacterium]|nr:type II CRISPR RNA-guided endonuclease Cas9 [Bacteroidales bacterium]
MKKVLGLDPGTNSIGWAVVNAYQTEDNGLEMRSIEAAGIRIIPMDAAVLGDFDMGNTKSQTADRTSKRGARRLHERYLLRRERLHRVLSVMDFLPEHYAEKLDKYGHFQKESEPKLAWNNGQFLFMDSFNEMLADFAINQPELVANGKKVPLDWTVYYLRKKALTQVITKEELAWILLQFNQKRGYNQLRDEEEDQKNDVEETIISTKILKVEKQEKDKKYEKYWYQVSLENEQEPYRAAFYNDISFWEGTIREFVKKVTTLKDGSQKTEFSFLPTFDEIDKMDGKRKNQMYSKIKLKTEKSITDSGNTVGEYIYNSLLSNPDQKIIGKLVRTIERKYFKDELKAIINKQKEFIPELNDSKLYAACIEELYPSNDDYRNSIASRDFTYLLVEDVLFYQRPLKSKKSTIANCPYESHFDKDGNEYPIKCVAKSNPFFQEFRLWQFISYLRIYERQKLVGDKLFTDVDVTNEFIRSEDELVNLFDFLNDKKEITQDSLLTTYFKIKKPKGKDTELPYRWNYVEDKTYPCNKTRAVLLSKLAKEDKTKLTKELEYGLWHLLYSVNSKTDIDAVFAENKRNNSKGIYHKLLEVGFSDESIENLKKAKFDEKDYGSYSEKAIKKLLSLMRMGKYWNQDNIDAKTLDRIDKIISGEYDEKIRNRVREKAIHLTEISHFKGLPIWLACYIIYDRHSEASEIQKWEKPEDIDKWLKDFKQHSLRNPIVEQVVTETMRTVRDIWKQVGNIDEIHVELGREMKNPADKRKKMTKRINENENTNLRIKAMLMEFQNPEFGIENVRPYSPTQQDILRIYEEGALQELSDKDKDFDFISKISKTAQPSKSDIIRYKCWLEQKYQSPYTGQMIPLGKLFTTAYEIEHVIPQSRYFDDSFSNKVICEAEVNSLKDNQLGFEFIKNHHGEKVTLTGGKVVEILTIENYQKFVREHYTKNPSKMKRLLMDDIPDKFIERQLNDSRYISKYIKGILSNIVREKDENGNIEQEAVSKNLISCNGNITDRLKKDWGMNDVWNRIILPRFIRMNEMNNKISPVELQNEFKRLFELEIINIAQKKGITINCSYPDFYKTLENKEQKDVIDKVMKELPITDSFLSVNNEGHIIPAMPLELQKGFNKKRIDHRHHAMDAIVIACTTRDHVNLLNNEAALSEHKENRYALSHKLRRYETEEIPKKVKNSDGCWVDGDKIKRLVPKEFLKPWETFTQDAQSALENIIVSFKQNLRVINKTTNYYETYKDENGALRIGKNGKPKKDFIKQKKGESCAVRKSMHKDTVFGEVNLRFKEGVSLNEALKDPKAIVNKDFKAKVLELLSENRDAKYIKKYVEDNKDIWSDINLKKIEVYYFTKDTNDRYFATRKPLDTSFNKKKIEESVTDTGIQKILLAHLESKGGNAELAFSPDGIDEMNKNIFTLNGNRFHQPVLKVRVYEKADKFAIGQTGNKGKKFVEAGDGTNLYYMIYQDSQGHRIFVTIPFKMSLECQKEGKKEWIKLLDDRLRDKSNNIKLEEYQKFNIPSDASLLFILSPYDLVYVPNESVDKAISNNRIYVVNDFNDTTIYFRPHNIAKAIASKEVDMRKKFIKKENETKVIGSYDDKTANFEGQLIKDVCVPIKVDRLGNIIEINGKKIND